MTAAAFVAARLVAAQDIDAGGALRLLQLDAAPIAIAGQYVTLRLPGEPESARYFSLASPPGAAAELLVRAVAEPRGFDPAGLQPGAALELSAQAAGRLTLATLPPRPALFLFGAGTGIAPLRAIIRAGVDSGTFGRVVVVHAVRAPEPWAFYDELRADEARGALRYLTVATGAETPLAALRGRIPAAIDDGSLERAAGVPLVATLAAALVCGSAAMVRDTVDSLARRGLRVVTAPGEGEVGVEG